jgi:hypothetical protein
VKERIRNSPLFPNQSAPDFGMASRISTACRRRKAFEHTLFSDHTVLRQLGRSETSTNGRTIRLYAFNETPPAGGTPSASLRSLLPAPAP